MDESSSRSGLARLNESSDTRLFGKVGKVLYIQSEQLSRLISTVLVLAIPQNEFEKNKSQQGGQLLCVQLWTFVELRNKPYRILLTDSSLFKILTDLVRFWIGKKVPKLTFLKGTKRSTLTLWLWDHFESSIQKRDRIICRRDRDQFPRLPQPFDSFRSASCWSKLQ